MIATVRSRSPWPLVAAACVALIGGACNETSSLGVEPEVEPDQPLASRSDRAEHNVALAELRRATARYHNFAAAVADGFVLLHGCEERPGEGQVGAVYVRFDRLSIGIDPSRPQGLLYEPGRDGRMSLLGAEFAIPFDLWTEPEPPEFLGVPFQPEEEFGVYGLHVWLWRHNPEGMFAPANPRVTCEAE